ncbi:MAG: phosphatidylcholine/phosphatidylserine synthase [Chlamydiales bacterium]|nr:phosphatidylcholine/phosphatidylserine synthase [Chlamydiales bacterium]
MKRINLLPNLITAFGLACGLFVIFRTLSHAPHITTYQFMQTSVLLLIVAGFADVLDGAIARLMRHESEFGALFDSLADAISFGVAPSVLMLKTLSTEQETPMNFLCIVAAMLYSICGVLRLVRFNVKAHEAQKTASLRDYHKNFSGLPIPAAAGATVSANLFLYSPFADSWFSPSDAVRSWVLIGVMVFIGLLMISKVRFFSLKTFQIRVRSSTLVFFTAVGALFVLYGILHFFSIFVLAFAWLYVLLGCILTIIRLIAGSKSKALKDFEPEDLE